MGNHIERQARIVHGPALISKKWSDLGNTAQQIKMMHVQCRQAVRLEAATNISNTLKEIVKRITVILLPNYQMEDSKSGQQRS